MILVGLGSISSALGIASSRLRFVPAAVSEGTCSGPKSAGRLCRLRGGSEGGGINFAGLSCLNNDLARPSAAREVLVSNGLLGELLADC